MGLIAGHLCTWVSTQIPPIASHHVNHIIDKLRCYSPGPTKVQQLKIKSRIFFFWTIEKIEREKKNAGRYGITGKRKSPWTVIKFRFVFFGRGRKVEREKHGKPDVGRYGITGER